jgi:hypothetical protein
MVTNLGVTVMIITLVGAARKSSVPSWDMETKHLPGATKTRVDSDIRQTFSVLDMTVTGKPDVAEILNGSIDFVMTTVFGRFQFPIV